MEILIISYIIIEVKFKLSFKDFFQDKMTPFSLLWYYLNSSFTKHYIRPFCLSVLKGSLKRPLNLKQRTMHSLILIWLKLIIFLLCQDTDRVEYKTVSCVSICPLSLMKLNNAWGTTDCNNKYALKFLTMQRMQWIFIHLQTNNLQLFKS